MTGSTFRRATRSPGTSGPVGLGIAQRGVPVGQGTRDPASDHLARCQRRRREQDWYRIGGFSAASRLSMRSSASVVLPDPPGPSTASQWPSRRWQASGPMSVVSPAGLTAMPTGLRRVPRLAASPPPGIPVPLNILSVSSAAHSLATRSASWSAACAVQLSASSVRWASAGGSGPAAAARPARRLSLLWLRIRFAAGAKARSHISSRWPAGICSSASLSVSFLIALRGGYRPSAFSHRCHDDLP